MAIKGDVHTIDRVNGRTNVVTEEGMNTITYPLDESLIEFGTAIEDKDFLR